MILEEKKDLRGVHEIEKAKAEGNALISKIKAQQADCNHEYVPTVFGLRCRKCLFVKHSRFDKL